MKMRFLGWDILHYRTLPEKGIPFTPNHLRRLADRGLFPRPDFYLGRAHASLDRTYAGHLDRASEKPRTRVARMTRVQAVRRRDAAGLLALSENGGKQRERPRVRRSGKQKRRRRGETACPLKNDRRQAWGKAAAKM